MCRLVHKLSFFFRPIQSNTSHCNDTCLSTADPLEYCVWKLAAGDVVSLAYVSGSSPNLFTCQFYDDIPKLEALMEEIAAYAASFDTPVPVKSLNAGAPLLAKFSEDGVWYRAEVLTPEDSDGRVQVLFVDYGNTEPVSRADTLPIPQRFTKLHKQAATYCLGSASGGVREEWSDDAFTKFEELTVGSECLTATVLELREGQVVVTLKSGAGLDLAEYIL